MPENSKLFENLNPEQIQAVKHLHGPALVVAGPGSGKTRVLTHRIAYLIEEHGVPETAILCVTFTNKAANEIKERVGKLLGASTKLPWSGTFHSVCSKILRRHGKYIGIPPSFVIYDTDDQVSLIKQILKDFGIDSKRFNPRGVLEAISSAKSELVDAQTYSGYAQGYFQKTVARIFPEYQKRLRNNNALDFDDLLVECVNLFNQEQQVLESFQTSLQYVLVDEYQDTNRAQYVLTRLFSDGYRNLFVVGDMSQAIYSFRGADYRNILNFQSDYPNAKIYNLEQNYRSTQNILDSAKSVIKNNSSHIPLDLWTQRGVGEKLVIYTAENEKSEANFVVEEILAEVSRGRSFKDIAVLYRTNAQSRNIEEFLIRSNIPYKIVGGQRFYARKEIKDIIAFLRVVHNPRDSVSWQRIINVPPRGLGKKSVEEIEASGWDLGTIEQRSKLPVKSWISHVEKLATVELMDEIIGDTGYLKWLDDKTEENLIRIENVKELRSVAAQFTDLAEFLENVSLIESSDKPNMDEKNVVTLMTVHASKGLEFPVIYIIGMEEGIFPHAQSVAELNELEEERRLCYVAITRAMDKVTLTNTFSRLYFGTVQVNIPSRFLTEIPESLTEVRSADGGPGLGFLRRKGGSTTSDFLDDLDYNRNNFSWD